MILLLCCFSPHILAQQVIVNSSVTTDSLTTSQLRRIYSMRQVKWPDDSRIVVFVLPSKHPVHQAFCKETLRIFPYQIERIWNKLTFSGLGTAPNMVETQQQLLDAVTNTPGAIGYIDGDTIKGDSVNVIKISQ